MYVVLIETADDYIVYGLFTSKRQAAQWAEEKCPGRAYKVCQYIIASK